MISTKLLSYWHKNLIEAKYQAIDDEKIKPAHTMSRQEFMDGKVQDKQFLKSIRDEKKEFLICPYAYHKKTGKNPYLLFVYLPVEITHGGIICSINKKPFISRKYLRPSENELTISSLEKVDQFWKDNIFPEGLSWLGVIEITEKFARSVFDWQTRLNRKYKLINQVMIIDAKASSDNDHAIKKILDFYQDTLQNPAKLKPLAKKIIQLENVEQTTIVDHQKFSLKHLGQMNPDYGLTPSQRKTIHHYLDLKIGDCLAIEGPPGTGKTTLLQSVIASLWVDRAYQESSQAPVILASGTTNLAIRNILDMFDGLPIKTREKFPPISDFDRIEKVTERWIEGVNSLGTFCVADSKRSKFEEYQLLLKNGYELETNWIDFQNIDIFQLGELEKTFIAKCEDYFQAKITSTDDAKSWLHQALTNIIDKMYKPLNNFVEKESLDMELQSLKIEHKLNSFAEAQALFQSRLDESEHQLKAFKQQRLMWYEYLGKRRTIKNILKIPILGPWLEGRWLRANQYYMEQNFPDLSFLGYTEALIENGLTREEEVISLLVKQFQKLLSEQTTLVDRYQKMMSDQKRYEREWADIGIPLDRESAEAHFDCNYRYLAFWLATHYWEARYLIEVKKRLSEENKSFMSLYSSYREMAMLTPCFISTMHSAPKFFQNKHGFLHGFADLLIIDEASQALPELAFPVFTFAQKVVVVGDTKQLPPIPAITMEQDMLNIQSARLTKTQEELDDLSVRSINGSVMKLANRITRFIDNAKPFMLQEHFRCHSQIAKYFNQTFYHNQLIINTHDRNDYNLPPLAYAQVNGQEEVAGSSRVNHFEAASIALWVEKFFNQHQIPNEKRNDILAILTPFSAQADVIKKYLKKLEIEGQITVDTVHSLQGMQREVVLFSPTYTDRETKELFFDRDAYILNVAASRAKQSFLIFGDMECFGMHQDKASAILKGFCDDATDRLVPPKREEVDLLLDSPAQEEREVVRNEFNFYGDVNESIIATTVTNSTIKG